MELFRSLAVLAEAPGRESERSASLLGLGALPTRAEHTDVMVFQLYPYASVYLGGEGMLGGEVRDRIAGFWRALGEAPPPEPDHLAVLLSAYAELAEREIEAEENRLRSTWRHARTAFLWEHLVSWLPVYLDKMRELDSDFYSRWAALLGEALVEECSGLSAPETLPLHLREARPLRDLGDAGGDEFLRAVTSPVRTGMVLVRSDLERCASALGLGLRKGERRFALKSLLGQAPWETLEWLAGEADRWVERHETRMTAPPMISRFWQARAEAASAFLRESADLLEDFP